MTKVLVWPADADACAEYRLKLPAAAVTAAGSELDVEVTDKGLTVYWGGKFEGDTPPLNWPIMGIARPDADVVVMQRPARWHWARLIPYLQEHGIKVVVDMDDHFDAIEREHFSYAWYDPRSNPAFNRRHARDACRAADLVTVTTPALLEHYGFGHGVVIPNRVPESYLKVEPAQRRRAVGWSGSVVTHPTDLDVTRGSIPRVLPDDWDIHIVGTGEHVARALRADPERITHTEGWVSFADYPAALAEFGVGIVPLADNRFNEAKSGLKLLEMSSVGVPTVASPTPDNLRLAGDGLGMIAKRPREWASKVGALIRSQDLRDEVAGRSREAAAAHTVEGHVEDWVRAWTP